MKLGDDLGGITKLGSQQPRRLLVGTLVARPSDKVEEVARSLTTVNFGVEYFSDFVLGLAINDNRCRWGFGVVQDCIRNARF